MPEVVARRDFSGPRHAALYDNATGFPNDRAGLIGSRRDHQAGTRGGSAPSIGSD
jgi:hypothetical protein